MDKDIKNFLDNVSLILGFMHGSLAAILLSPDVELRTHLERLKEEMDKRISKLYYKEEIH